MNLKPQQWKLMLMSFIVMFLELVIIRWLSTEIRIFSYFKNLPLMAAFLGFGLGFLLQEKSDRLFGWFPKLICYLTVVIAGAKGFGITHVIFTNPEEFFLLGSWPSAPSVLQKIRALLVIVSLFFLVTATFSAIASKLGNLLNREKVALTSYSINVLGSLLGILAFFSVSYLEWPPAVWLAVALLPLIPFYHGALRAAESRHLHRGRTARPRRVLLRHRPTDRHGAVRAGLQERHHRRHAGR
jgi:hypothetical protein